MIVNNKAEFDAAMATANSSTIIELPGGTIDWELIVNNECNIVGNDTIVDLTGGAIQDAIHITADADLQGFSVINDSDKDGVYVDNCGPSLSQISASCNIAFKIEGNGGGAELEDLDATNAEKGFYLLDARNFNFTGCRAHECNMGFDLEGTSATLGDTEDDPAWGGTPGDPLVVEADRTNRTHNNGFNSCLSYENKIGVRLVNSNHNVFDNICKIYDNTNLGIWQMPNSYSNSHKGEIYGNINYGVRNTDRATNLHDFDASSTWWGHITGPSGSGSGEGEKISNYVIYQPFLKTGTEPDLIYTATRDWMWGMLGAPIVRVELTEEHVTESINIAIDKFMYYKTPEVNYAYTGNIVGQEFELSNLKDKDGNPISVTKEQVIEVIYQPYEDLFSQLTGSESSFFLTYYMQKSGGTFLADFYIAMGYKDTFEKTLGLYPSWEFISNLQINGIIKDIIRIYPRPSIGLNIGVKYSRTLTEAEVDNNMWIRKYALTWAKEQLGRIRSKFASIPSPTGETSLDGGTLLAEAQQEREALLLDLISRSEPLTFSVG